MTLEMQKPFLLLLVRFCFPFVFLTLQGCSNTQFGKDLSNSFEEPLTNSVKTVPKEDTKKQPSVSKTFSSKSENIEPVEKKKNKKKRKAVARPLVALPPHPYRITIKLSGADPSAPAEAVTEALRMAGVPFEVEMIERVEVIPVGKSRTFGRE